ncbi:MAG: hypothetical protein SNJ72_10790 [Fimbriimonadales bacterium]
MQGKVYARRVEAPEGYRLWQELGLAETELRWFGWNETQMSLPQPFAGILPDESWDCLVLFSPQAEIRLIRVGDGYEALLLTEMSQTPPDGWSLVGEYAAEESRHLLIGERGQETDETTLVEVAYPRTFQYGMPVPRSHRVVAIVKHYLEPTTARLVYTRYMRVVTDYPHYLKLEV